MNNIFNEDDDDLQIGGLLDDDISSNRNSSFRGMQLPELQPPQRYEGSLSPQAKLGNGSGYRLKLNQMALDIQAINGNIKQLVEGRMPTKQKGKHAVPTETPVDRERLQRGRQSAKESRARKKLYIDLMELKLSKLEEEKEMLELELGQVRRSITDASAYGPEGGCFLVGLHKTFKKLQELFEKKQESDLDEINIILDSMRYRIGASGKERINSFNEYLKQILSICFPAMHRYLLWSAAEKQHVFRQLSDPSEPDEWEYQSFLSTLNLTEEQLRQLRSSQPRLKVHKQELDAIMKELYLNKNALFKHSEEIDDEMENFRGVLGALQCARLVFFIQRNRYRPELGICERAPTAEYQEELKREVPQVEQRRKKVKRS